MKLTTAVRHHLVEGSSPYEFTIDADGVTVFVEISGCSMWYPYYGMQFILAIDPSAPTIRKAIVQPKPKIAVHGKPIAEVAEMVKQEALKWLAKNGIARLQKIDHDGAVKMAKINAELDRHYAAEERKAAKEDARQKAKGFTHRVDAWVHGHGDDKPISYYSTTKPSTSSVEAVLKSNGSSVLTDYSVTEL